jgi:hypothetical protein
LYAMSSNSMSLVNRIRANFVERPSPYYILLEPLPHYEEYEIRPELMFFGLGHRVATR